MSRGMLAPTRRLSKALPFVVLAALVAAPSAFAQATRTWVSGVGDDANPCSRTAPCKTFAGAISKTAAHGEINVLDPGGFGALTITKAITIDGNGFNAGVLVSGSNGFVINAGTGDNVTLRNLDMDGLDTSLDGVRILTAKTVNIEDSKIYGFTNGVDLQPTGVTRLNVLNSVIINNSGDGVVVAPPAGGAGLGTLTGDDVHGNGCGVVTGSYGLGSFSAASCGTNNNSSPNAGAASVSSFHSAFNANAGAGVFSEGPRASNYIADNEVTANAKGLEEVDGGLIFSWGNNFVNGNTNNTFLNGGTITAVTPMLRRAHARR